MSSSIYTFQLRQPYWLSFGNAFSTIQGSNSQLFMGSFAGLPEKWAADMNRFFEAETCHSPALQRFEVYLHLAYMHYAPYGVLREYR